MTMSDEEKRAKYQKYLDARIGSLSYEEYIKVFNAYLTVDKTKHSKTK